MKVATETILLLISGYLMSLLILPSSALASVDKETGSVVAMQQVIAADETSTLNLFSQGKATWLWFDVYQAKLFTTEKVVKKINGSTVKKSERQATLLSDKTPINLQLCYQQDITKEQIIEAAMEGLPTYLTPSLKRAVNQLHQSYQTVKPGDCYTLIHNSQGETILSFNGQEKFRTALPGFKKLYYGIWIGDKALSQSLKKSLLKESS